jgi:hypothetical protein
MRKTVQLDAKRRASFGPAFSPGDSFSREISGNVVIFRKQEHREQVARVRIRKSRGYTVGVLDSAMDEVAVKKALAEFP